jgi:hypothetical protein
MLRFTTALIAAFILARGVADAATLSTPLVGAGTDRVIQCIATNVGLKPAEVSITLYDANGDEMIPTSDSCAPAPIGPHASCASQAPPSQVAACVVESSSRSIRAAIEVFDGPDVVSVVPATAK